MTVLATAQVLAVPLLLGATSVEYGVRSETATRTRSIQGESAQTTVDVGVSPRIALDLDDRRLTLRLAYAPSVHWFDVGAGQGADVVHGAEVSGSWRFDRTWRLRSSANAAYGTQDFLGSPQTGGNPGQPFQPVPAVSTVKYGHLDASVGLEGELGRDVRTSFSCGYSVDGGVDAESRQSLPLLRGVRLDGSLDWSATRTGRFVLTAMPSVTEESTGRRAVIVVGTAGWRERSSAHSEWWLSIGGGAYHVEGGGQPSSGGLLPGGELGYQHTIQLGTRDASFQGEPQAGDRDAQRSRETPREVQEPGIREAGQGGHRSAQQLQQVVVLRASPYFDRLAAAVYTLVEARGTATWVLSERWRLEGTMTGGIAPRQNESPVSSATVEARVGWRPWKLELYGGLRGLWQRDLRVAPEPIRQWGAFLGVAFDDVERL